MPHYYSFHPKEAVSVTAVLVKYMKQLADKSEKRRNSIQEKSATAEGSVENDDGGESGVPLPAKEVDFCQLISALRMPEKSSVASPGLNSGAQLFSIADIAPLRNTLAIHVQTTPKTDTQEGFFQRERNAADVVEILSRSGGSASAIPTDKENSVTSVWLTVEELCEQMNFLVLFRCLDGLYQNTAVVEYESTGGSAQEATSGGFG
ncbi:hypothetical protein AGDE_16681 [Angomonas deanei]|uniref:Uncharacterized protein n=1 Tax=Angomonas deanei TaxID=59799 RepID=A0A7G2CC94_9TRYP|nr:hypothetical protein AGDE_16681 [Angomonas deanei]CAD2216343.1 hypothetical protein, conserved [Angomonas deanei]|eukprot:EPY16629.1 hypothetical protein AGDE_16681 [Angomonas deanei]